MTVPIFDGWRAGANRGAALSRQRVQLLESALQMPAASKLDTVWQAVIWRASALANNVTLPAENLNHALPTQD